MELALRLVSDTLDDLQHRVLAKLLDSPTYITRATRGEFREVSSVLLELRNPRARLGRGVRQGRLFSSLGELLWYLAGSNELNFISYYIKKYRDESSDGITIRGSYGERLFKSNQIYRVIGLLRSKNTSRRAVLQLFHQKDLRNDFEVPCTISLQLLLRNGKLDMIASMRSNDAFIGMPHDIFAFTMIQEIIARELDVDVGRYVHFVGSLHLYSDSIPQARAYINDGFQRRQAMPAMPIGSPLRAIKTLLSAEREIRENGKAPDSVKELESYWGDLAILLRAYKYIVNKDYKGAHRLKDRLSSNFYHQYIDLRVKKAIKQAPGNLQDTLDLN